MFTKTDTHKRALVYWNRAATQGYNIARLKLGDYYFYGKGTQVDYQQAASHYKYASEVSHNPQAMFNLAYMHENGLGLRKDMHLAKRFYDMASETSSEAHVPVVMALLKLNVLNYFDDILKGKVKDLVDSIDILCKHSFVFKFVYDSFTNPAALFGDLWDIYLITILSGIITAIYFIRRRAL